jgi:hypothetical protein
MPDDNRTGRHILSGFNLASGVDGDTPGSGHIVERSVWEQPVMSPRVSKQATTSISGLGVRWILSPRHEVNKGGHQGAFSWLACGEASILVNRPEKHTGRVNRSKTVVLPVLTH